MTNDETHKLMGEAAAELANTRKKIACLETKAEGYIRTLTKASSALRGSLGDRLHEDATIPDAREWPTTDQIEELCNDLDETATRNGDLVKRMREWGIMD